MQLSRSTPEETIAPQQPLRIVHIQPMSLDLFGHEDADLGGDVRYSVSNLAVAQARMGDEPTIHLLTSGASIEHTFDGVQVRFHRCLQPPGSFGRFARQFSHAILKSIDPSRVDVLHFHGTRQFHAMFAIVANRAATLGVPLIGQERGFRNVGLIETLAQRYGLRRCAAVLAASRDGMIAVERLGVPLEKISLLPNGFDPGIFFPRPRSSSLARSTPLRVIVVSRLMADKDPLTMAHGLEEARRRGTEIAVRLFGSGSLRDQTAAILDRAAVPAIFTDHVSHVELAREYQNADVLVRTCRDGEGWCQAVVEAMACGLPVIASNVPGIRDAGGNAAILVAAGDARGLADALGRLANSHALRLSLREAGLTRAAGLTWDAVARELRRRYGEVLQA